MNNDWIPFAQPVRYVVTLSVYRKKEGWVVAWRPEWTDDDQWDANPIWYLDYQGGLIDGREIDFPDAS